MSQLENIGPKNDVGNIWRMIELDKLLGTRFKSFHQLGMAIT